MFIAKGTHELGAAAFNAAVEGHGNLQKNRMSGPKKGEGQLSFLGDFLYFTLTQVG